LRAAISAFDLSRYIARKPDDDRHHYGLLARDGCKNVIKLLDAFNAAEASGLALPPKVS